MSTGHRCVRKQALNASVLVRKCLGINKNAPDRLKHTRSPDQSPFTPLPSNQVLACRCVSEMVLEVAAIDPLVAEAARRAPSRLANLGENINNGAALVSLGNHECWTRARTGYSRRPAKRTRAGSAGPHRFTRVFPTQYVPQSSSTLQPPAPRIARSRLQSPGWQS